jgi:signal transduction histidine kinase
VLVADDEEGIRDVAQAALELDGHRVFTAGDGAQALDLFREHRPDVVVSDIRMPRMDGITLLEQIRDLSPGTEVVLITGFADTALVIDALRRGASNLIEKPFRPSELIQQLQPSFLRRGLALDAARLRQEVEAGRKRLELHQRMATMGRLLSGLAHEINNPLTFLKGNVEILRHLLARAAGESEPEERRAASLRQAQALLDDMGFGARRIEELVAAMRRFGSPVGSSRRLVALREVMDNCLKLTQAKRSPGTRLEVERPAPEVLVDADPVELETCFVNLLVNAYEALQVQGASVRFAASLLPYATGAFHGLVEVSVTDDGPGIPQGTVDEVFTPFFTRKQGGMGLGLSLAYEAAKRNGAQIEIHTAEGQGARVVVRMPYRSGEEGLPGSGSVSVSGAGCR